MLCAIARGLDEQKLDEIRGLENELGLTLVAFACRIVDPAKEEKLKRIEAELGPVLLTPPAEPDDAQLARIRAVERQLALSLVAVENQDA